MRHFYVASAFLVAGGVSLFFGDGSLPPFTIAQLCVLGAVITILFGVLGMNKAP